MEPPPPLDLACTPEPPSPLDLAGVSFAPQQLNPQLPPIRATASCEIIEVPLTADEELDQVRRRTGELMSKLSTTILAQGAAREYEMAVRRSLPDEAANPPQAEGSPLLNIESMPSFSGTTLDMQSIEESDDSSSYWRCCSQQ